LRDRSSLVFDSRCDWLAMLPRSPVRPPDPVTVTIPLGGIQPKPATPVRLSPPGGLGLLPQARWRDLVRRPRLRIPAVPCEKRAYSKSHEAVSIAKLLISLGFAIWVSVCAAAPEFIWQGLLQLLHHFSRQTAYSIVLIGLILTVFIKPILARARDGQWRPQHRSTQSLLFTAPIAFISGVAAVGLHECMTAYLGAPGAAPRLQREATARGAHLILEWACIPLAVTIAWFSAPERRDPLPGWRLRRGLGDRRRLVLQLAATGNSHDVHPLYRLDPDGAGVRGSAVE
jgi:hypothetical protein